MLTNKVPEQDVHDLFTRVAPKYDLMNNIVSLGIQKSWRKKFLRQLDLNKNSICLDLCCGSADSTIDLAKKAKLVTGLDFKDRKSTRLNSSHVSISYAVFCLKKKNFNNRMYA